MNYQFLSCGINGNYDNTGLSARDQLAIHIMYPERERVADIAGTTVVRLPDALQLESAWQWAGANMNFVAHNYDWRLNGKTVSTSPLLTAGLLPHRWGWMVTCVELVRLPPGVRAFTVTVAFIAVAGWKLMVMLFVHFPTLSACPVAEVR
jgi:hypothetical protein